MLLFQALPCVCWPRSKLFWALQWWESIQPGIKVKVHSGFTAENIQNNIGKPVEIKYVSPFLVPSHLSSEESWWPQGKAKLVGGQPRILHPRNPSYIKDVKAKEDFSEFWAQNWFFYVILYVFQQWNQNGSSALSLLLVREELLYNWTHFGLPSLRILTCFCMTATIIF